MTTTPRTTWRWLNTVFWAAVAVSVVHYADNYFNYAEFPLADGPVPNPTRATVGAAWFLFTGVGMAGYLLYRAGRSRAAAGCIAFYSISGLVGAGHYLAPGMVDEVWWRQAHVIADLSLGVAVLGVAVRIAREGAVGREPSRPMPGRRA